MKKIPVEWQEGVEGPVKNASAEELRELVAEAVRKARRAQLEWRQKPVHERAAAARRIRHGLAGAVENLGPLIMGGRAPEEVYASEMIPFLEACKFLEKNATSILAPRRRTRGGRPFWLGGVSHEIRREPFGVVLVVGPSNYPFFLPGVQVMQALVAGNSVLLKPGRGGAIAAAVLKRLVEQAGVNSDLLQILSETPDAAITALQCGVDRLVVTGSLEAGRVLLRECAERITPATVELSGWDPVFVLPDADIDLAARSVAFGVSLNEGRTCIAPRRVFVWKAAEDEFIPQLRNALGRSDGIVFQENNERVIAMAAQAIAGGARVIHGRVEQDGKVKGPLVLKVSTGGTVQHEEIFGPVLSLTTVTNQEEALLRMQESDFALGASIFSRNIEAARALAEKLEVGVVTINDVIVPTADPRVPFGGRGLSGFGVTRGKEGLLEMTRVKVVSTNSSRYRQHLRGRHRGDEELFAAYSMMAHGRGRARWAGVKKLWKAVRERGGNQ